MNIPLIIIVLTFVVACFYLTKKSGQNNKKACDYLYQDENFNKYDKITNSLVMKIMMTKVTRYDMILQKNWYLSEKELMFENLKKSEKMIISERQSYLVPMNWFKYYTLIDDFENAKIHYDRIMKNTDEKELSQIKEITDFYKIVLDFHLENDFGGYDSLKSMINDNNYPVFNSWYYYELAFSSKCLNKIDDLNSNIEMCLKFAGKSFFKEKINSIRINSIRI